MGEVQGGVSCCDVVKGQVPLVGLCMILTNLFYSVDCGLTTRPLTTA